jgi:hypothetical protein
VRQADHKSEPDHSEIIVTPRPVIRLIRSDQVSKDTPFTGLINRLGSARITRTLLMTAPKRSIDPYLLLLLADQELVEGREEQARYLVEAAYEVFDRKTDTGIHTLFH